MLTDLLEPAAKRVLALLPVLLGVSLLVFALTAVGLGDPARAMLGQRADPELVEQIRRDYALDRPVYERYAGLDVAPAARRSRDLLSPAAPGGRDHRGAAARHRAAGAWPPPSLSVVVGMGAGVRPRSGPALLDQVLMSAAVLGISTPVFWLGMMLSLLFAVWLGWLPVSGYGDGAWANLVLPALTLGAIHTGTIARMARSSLLEVVRQDYIQTARAKGLAEWRVMRQACPAQRPDPGGHRDRHRARRSARGRAAHRDRVRLARPRAACWWPRWGQRDLPVVMGAVLVFAVIYVVANLIVDLAYLVDRSADPPWPLAPPRSLRVRPERLRGLAAAGAAACIVGAALVGLFAASALLAPWLAPYDPAAVPRRAQRHHAAAARAGAPARHRRARPRSPLARALRRPRLARARPGCRDRDRDARGRDRPRSPATTAAGATRS